MKKVSSEVVLLDVNVLLALAWPNHQFHDVASRRLETGTEKWATCALTELGFVRLSSNRSVVGTSKSPIEAALLLADMVQDSRHIYFRSMPSPTSQACRPLLEGILGYKQVTDAYLLSLALENQAVLLTFDTRIASLSPLPIAVEVLV